MVSHSLFFYRELHTFRVLGYLMPLWKPYVKLFLEGISICLFGFLVFHYLAITLRRALLLYTRVKVFYFIRVTMLCKLPKFWLKKYELYFLSLFYILVERIDEYPSTVYNLYIFLRWEQERFQNITSAFSSPYF